MQTVRQIEFALVDMHLHHDYDPAGPKTPLQPAPRNQGESRRAMPPEYNRFLTNSRRLLGRLTLAVTTVTSGRGAFADAYSLFEQNGVLAPTLARDSATKILAVGGSRPALEWFKAFRGRRPRSTHCCVTMVDRALRTPYPACATCSSPQRSSRLSSPTLLVRPIAGWIKTVGFTIRRHPRPRTQERTTKELSRGGVDVSNLPYATQVRRRTFPVTCIRSPDCGAPCDQARALLVKRASLFRKSASVTQKDVDEVRGCPAKPICRRCCVGNQFANGVSGKAS